MFFVVVCPGYPFTLLRLLKSMINDNRGIQGFFLPVSLGPESVHVRLKCMPFYVTHGPILRIFFIVFLGVRFAFVGC